MKTGIAGMEKTDCPVSERGNNWMKSDSISHNIMWKNGWIQSFGKIIFISKKKVLI